MKIVIALCCALLIMGCVPRKNIRNMTPHEFAIYKYEEAETQQSLDTFRSMSRDLNNQMRGSCYKNFYGYVVCD